MKHEICLDPLEIVEECDIQDYIKQVSFVIETRAVEPNDEDMVYFTIGLCVLSCNMKTKEIKVVDPVISCRKILYFQLALPW